MKQEAIWKVGDSPYLLEDQSLKSIIKVRAIDKAGNERIVEIIPEIEPAPWWMTIIILAGIGVISFLLKKITKKNRDYL